MRAKESNQYLILFALWLLVFSASSQVMIVVAMLPKISQQLNITESSQGALVSVYALMVGLFALLTGPISDKFGRRRILLTGAGLMTLALLLHAVAFDYWTLLSMRLLAGIAGGTLSGAAVSYVGDYFLAGRHGWASGLVMSSIAVSQVVGIPLGTLLADWYGIHTPFLLFAITMGMTFLLVWKYVPQPAVPLLEEKLTLRTALENYRVLLRRAELKAAATAFFVIFFSTALFITYLPIWLAAKIGASNKEIAGLFFVGGIASVLTSPVSGRICDRLNRKKIIFYLCFALSGTMFLFPNTVNGVWLAYLFFFVVMILIQARMTAFQALLLGLVSGVNRGTLMSLVVSAGQIGFAAGSIAAGMIYTAFGYSGNTFVAALMALTTALLIWRYIPDARILKTEDKNSENTLNRVSVSSPNLRHLVENPE
jgi:predicted MFS family arabinose efflux permease